jgi:hypothetical protein
VAACFSEITLQFSANCLPAATCGSRGATAEKLNYNSAKFKILFFKP